MVDGNEWMRVGLVRVVRVVRVCIGLVRDGLVRLVRVGPRQPIDMFVL
jgi:hypothetical protein